MTESTPEERKTIYDASVGEIFWKNFLAGFGRALGGVFVYVLLLFFSYYLFMTYLLPKLTPLLNTVNALSSSLQSLPNVKSGITLPDNLNIQNLLGK